MILPRWQGCRCKYRGFRRTLRCLTIDSVVARLTIRWTAPGTVQAALRMTPGRRQTAKLCSPLSPDPHRWRQYRNCQSRTSQLGLLTFITPFFRCCKPRRHGALMSHHQTWLGPWPAIQAWHRQGGPVGHACHASRHRQPRDDTWCERSPGSGPRRAARRAQQPVPCRRSVRY